MITRATYTYQRARRVVGDFGPCCFDVDLTVELEAECFQDSGEGFLGEVCTVWTLDCLERLAAAGLSGDELLGCTEAVEEAFWGAELEACRVSKVRQQLGTVAA